MKKKHKAYLKINIVSLFFIAVSFISVTLAWFAYSGLASASTEIGVKAWYIELEKNGEAVSHNITISLSEIHPGMEPVNEIIKIKNKGDSNAQVKYSIVSARMLGDEKDNYIVNEETTSPYVEDQLAHEYPFNININLSKQYILAKDDEAMFEVSASWPLDSGNNELDSLWGNNAYNFQQEEINKKNLDPNYQIRPSIQVIITVTAEQYIEEENASDIDYDLGDVILFNPVTNQRCSELSDTCIKGFIIDINSTLKDQTLNLLPDPKKIYATGSFNDYDTLLQSVTSNWTVTTRALEVNDILKIIATDITDSYLVRENISDVIIGNLNYSNRINIELNKTISARGYYRFITDRFYSFTNNSCYWFSSEYDIDSAFAVKEIDDTNSKIYNENKLTNCNVIPVVVINK